MFQLTIQWGEHRSVLAYSQPVLLAKALEQARAEFSMPCAGRGVCGKCRVEARGVLSRPEEREKKLLGGALNQGMRLACMAQALGDAVITVPKVETAVLSRGELPPFPLQPEGRGLGAAVDVGTTTVAVYLYDLSTGGLLDEDAFPNPQSAYGADVIARIQKTLEGQGEAIRQCLQNKLGESLARLCENQGQTLDAMDNIVVTGNTTMLYLLLGEDPEPLSHAPFQVKEFFGRQVDPRALGISGLAGTRLYVPPLISGFVGGDLVSAVLSSGMTEQSGLVLLVDVGTNGEMALWDGQRLLCCSTAAGPAFEGAGITMGMPAAPGAISRVRREKDGLACGVIGGGKARGVCGSGVIDGIAALLDLGLIDSSGCILQDEPETPPLLAEYNGGPALELGDGVLLTQRDIREIQLAKASICAGVRTLLHEAGKEPEDLDALLLAGGFGSYIDCASAGRIGMIPEELVEKGRPIGNAAGMGAVMELLSIPCRDRSREIAAEAKSLELSTSAYYMDQYVEAMGFPEGD